MDRYIFKSKRLGFRNWEEKDKAKLGEINADPRVMKHFPSIQTQEQTNALVDRMKMQFTKNGFCYFAVDHLEHQEFIGFIGIAEQTFESDFTPGVDIGWRLAQEHWGEGYATEGAQRCLDFAFQVIGLEKIIAICPETNTASERVMQKIGMKKKGYFKHPLLSEWEHLEKCVCYEIQK